MSVTFFVPDYRNSSYELNVNNGNAGHLLRVGRILDDGQLLGSLSTSEMASLIYNLREFVLDHRNSPDMVRFTGYLVKLSILHGIALATNSRIAYG